MSDMWNYETEVIDYLNQIDLLEDSEDKQKLIEELAGKLVGEFTNKIDFIIDRIREIKSDVKARNVPRNLMNSLKEAIFCYVNGQYLSAIASIGITAELFCSHIFKLYLEGLNFEEFKIRMKMDRFNRISQSEKIDILYSVVNIDEKICSILREIKNKRNNSVHPNKSIEYKEDALHCLQCMAHILNIYSEIVSTKEISTKKKSIPSQRKEDFAMGSLSAPLVIFWYFDYQCPFCKKFWQEVLPEIKLNYIDTGKVRLVHKDFPLESIHPFARESAETAKCIQHNINDGEYLKIHNLIFERQSDINSENLKSWTREIGCNADFCLQNHIFLDEIQLSQVEATDVGALGTPYFFIGNSYINGAQPYEVFKIIIDKELANRGLSS